MTKKNNVIDFKQRTPVWVERGRSALLGLSERHTQNLVTYFANLFIADVADGLNGNEEAGEAYKAVIALLSEKAGGCYFCDKTIDGDKEQFKYGKKFCVPCMKKLSNILTAFGVNPNRIFPGLRDAVRKNQKWRYKDEE